MICLGGWLTYLGVWLICPGGWYIYPCDWLSVNQVPHITVYLFVKGFVVSLPQQKHQPSPTQVTLNFHGLLKAIASQTQGSGLNQSMLEAVVEVESCRSVW